MRDPYSILGVRRNAGPDEIKAAWRAMAKAVHPDQNRDDPMATARFAEAGRAYEVLKNPKLRSRYDDARREAELRRMEELHRKPREPEQPIGDVDPETAEEMVSRIFGSEPRARKPEPAATASAPVRPKTPTKPDAKPEPKAEAKPDIAADARPETKLETKVDIVEKPAPFAIFPRSAAPAAELVSAIVRRIRGAASKAVEKVPDIACEVTVSVEDLFNRTKATATLPDGQTLKVALPGGTTDGSLLRMKELGYRLNGMLRGDIVVTVRVRQDGAMRTEGLDLRTTLPIDIQNAVLGWETKVMTLTGPVDVTVPAWSGSDRVIRLAGHGLADADGKRADLLVELRLMLWENPDEKITDLMRSRQQGLFL
ncbi:DnaJ C-terminal domain-containing protein [Pararhizobium antarcticum]|uniref:Molecular chaperone DnaJ n=1 Tax=Pararhizobium antarcticum TaxID=1798805 RepID=A0A657LUX7_9HYPH|nr:DnaJ C-terminal domain-containing protein [Pararhizobium antarcticum]OJF98918.1 molecular chaperone DnaJ [Pararhizobium antarcticum]OJF98929.1 molecular chaperone DnaJ [Pararhizobium antarcticum]